MVHMRFVAIILAIMMLVLPLTDASTKARAFSRSYLILNDSSTGALKSISQNSFFYTPGLYIKGYGEAELRAKSENSDSMILDQVVYFSTIGSQYLGVVSSHIQARNLTDLDVSLQAIASTGILKDENFSLVKSESFGLGQAQPGEEKYAFYLALRCFMWVN